MTDETKTTDFPAIADPEKTIADQVPWRMNNPTKLLELVKAEEHSEERQNFLDVCAEVDDMYDRRPPDSDTTLAMEGLAWTNNVDWGAMEAEVDAAVSRDFALLHDPEVYVRIESGYSGPGQVFQKGVVEKEDARMLDEWDSWIPESGNMCLDKTLYGMGILYLRHPRSWQFRHLHPGNLLIVGSRSCNPDDWEVAAIPTKFKIPELLKTLDKTRESKQLEDGFADNGYSPEAIKKAIVHFCKKNGKTIGSDFQDAETWRNRWLGNDLWFARENRLEIPGYIIYVKEFDGKITEYLMTNEAKVGFLFRSVRKQRLNQMSDAFCMFPGSIGRNLFRQIRGFGIKNLAHFDAENQMVNSMLDSILLSNAIFLEGGQPDDLYRQQEMIVGAFAMLPDGLQIAAQQMPNNARVLAEVDSFFMEKRKSRAAATGGTGQGPAPDRESAKAATFRVHAAREQRQHHSSLFKLNTRSFHRLRFGRYMNGAMLPCDPGYEEAEIAKDRMRMKRVTQIFLDSIDLKSTMAATIFGDGDPVKLYADLMELNPFMALMTVEGRTQYMRDLANAKVGVERSRAYFGENLPDPTEQRNRVQAQYDNGHFESADGRLDIIGDDNHLIHATEHVQFLEAKAAAMQEGQLSPKEFFKTVSRAMPHIGMNPDGQPEGGHLANLLQDPTVQEPAQELVRRMTSMVNLRRQVEQQLGAQQQAEQERQIQDLRQPMEEQAKAAKVEQEMAYNRQIAELKIAEMQAEAEHKQQMRELEKELAEQKLSDELIQKYMKNDNAA